MLPLTQLTEDEQMLKEATADFAQSSIAPLVQKMDEQAKLDQSVIDECFEMGLMGVEIPEKYDGAGGTFMMSIVSIEQLSRVDASVGVFMDVQNTLVNNAFLNFGSEDIKDKYLAQLATKKVGAYCLSEASSGSDAFALKATAKLDGITTYSTGQNYGLPMPTKRTFLLYLLRSTLRLDIKESRPSWWSVVSKGSLWVKRRIN